VLDQMVQTVANIPGGISEVFVAILSAGPVIVFFVIALSPPLIVRSARRRRVREVEQDLPLALELLATLAEAGLGFDAALLRIVASESADRPLTSAFIAFQRELHAGVARLQG